jgi:hypothetical protein
LNRKPRIGSHRDIRNVIGLAKVLGDGGGQITPRRSYLDQGGTTPLLRAYAIDCPRCSC